MVRNQVEAKPIIKFIKEQIIKLLLINRELQLAIFILVNWSKFGLKCQLLWENILK
jgi:hypothetical protein